MAYAISDLSSRVWSLIFFFTNVFQTISSTHQVVIIENKQKLLKNQKSKFGFAVTIMLPPSVSTVPSMRTDLCRGAAILSFSYSNQRNQTEVGRRTGSFWYNEY